MTETPIGPAIVMIQKAEGSCLHEQLFKPFCSATTLVNCYPKSKQKVWCHCFSFAKFLWHGQMIERQGNNTKLGYVLLCKFEKPSFCYELWLTYYCFSFKFFKTKQKWKQIICFSNLDYSEKKIRHF